MPVTGIFRRLRFQSRSGGRRFCCFGPSIKKDAWLPITERVLGDDHPEVLLGVQLYTPAVVIGTGCGDIGRIESGLERKGVGIRASKHTRIGK
jgi:hypothetical protein